jgi:DNA polymerase-3 subunit delta
MIYLLYGLEEYLLKKEVKKIIEKEKIEDINISYYSMNNDKLEVIIDDFQTYSFFSDKKLVVVEDSFVFTSKKGDIEQKIELLDKYLNNYNPDTIIIFTVIDEKLDSRKKLFKIINKVGHIIECNSPKDLKPIVKEMFLNYNISPKALELFIDRVGKNLGILNSEANKIMIYKDNDLNITEEDILNLTSKIIVEEDLFKLVDYIIKKDKKEALIYYNGLLKLEMEPFKIIVTLANKIRLIYQTKELFRLGHTENDIVTILKINPKQIYFLREPIRKYNSEDLINILSKLADLDLNIKSGKIDSKKGLELFILNL